MGSGASGGDVKNVIGETEQEKALALLYEETHGNGNGNWDAKIRSAPTTNLSGSYN